MSRNTKRKLDDLDAIFKSDSEDGDYDNSAPAANRPRHRAKSHQRSGSRKPIKRKRERYGSSEDDIEDDDVDSEEEASFSDSDESGDSDRNPLTGRRRRAAAVKEVNYGESSEGSPSEDENTPPPNTSHPHRPLIVKLHIDPEKMRNLVTTRSGRVSGTKAPTPDVADPNVRRSSRISASEEPLMQLTNSGRHVEFTRRSSGHSTDDQIRRPTRGGKGAKKVPSAIMEASQENSGPQELADDGLAPPTDEDELMNDEPDAFDRFGGAASGDDTVIKHEGKHEADVDDDDLDDEPVMRRTSRTLRTRVQPQESQPERRSLRARTKPHDQGSDFEPDADEDEVEENFSEEDELGISNKARAARSDSDSGLGRRSGRLAKRTKSQRASGESDAASELDLDEIADEAADLEEDRRRNKRPRRGRRNNLITYEPMLRNRSVRPDYRIFRPELQQQLDDDDVAAPATASQGRGRKGNNAYRSLFSTLGPFGGAGGPMPGLGGPYAGGTAAGGADSDSSDDDGIRRPSHAMGGAVGMTPNQNQGAFGLVPQQHNADAAQAGSGAPANFGKIKDPKALADADPLGVDPTVNFDAVGGLGDHIDRLKEMVALPLLYPEIFMRMRVTPPRGVLFHGPPGTGKTLLARALASSVSSHGKKVSFYMRKGADALSKWVGEAERQLRLLFEEARKNQPSIIFFDEIDGLAPVRSSKQEQIHASIVATLLALMDGMDGRGQVIVIGATNRPDSVDPALRRPGRFDREFYFPLPNKDARRAIIDIHTKGWEPALQTTFKDQLAELTKGYGGADLRALCTEAALNAVQGTFPQIYSSNKKLLIDPSQIKVLAKDFMISVNKIVPSSERSASSGSAPLKKAIEPLLRNNLAEIQNLLKEVIPQTKKRTALEEAEYDDRDDELGFEKENMQREFEGSRIFRPRLLISGVQGMGQQYLGAALLNKFEGMYVANFDLPNIYKDSTRSPEAAIVQMFEEVKRHKPSVIYIPSVDIWYQSLQDSAIRTFTGLLRGLAPTDPVLLLGIMETNSVDEAPDKLMMRDLFGYSAKNLYRLNRPDEPARREYFSVVIDYLRKSPAEFPDPENRKKRDIPQLPEAPAPVEQPKAAPTKAELKAQKKHESYTLNSLKVHIQPVMDQLKMKYRKFRNPPIDERAFAYLFDEQDPGLLTTDLAEDEAQQHMVRPYRREKDSKGVDGLLEVETGRFFYNLDIVVIEQRLVNGYYFRPSDFLGDIKRLLKDAKTLGEPDRLLKAQEMYANVEVDMMVVEKNFPALVADCQAIYQRRLALDAEAKQKAIEAGQEPPAPTAMASGISSTDASTAPVLPGVEEAANETAQQVGSNLSNGSVHHGEDDVEMGNTQDNVEKKGDFATSTHGTQARSQHSSVIQMAPGSQPKDYVNSTSTTTSGMKSNERSDRISDQTGSSRLSNGIGHGTSGIDFSMIEPSGGSQLPDTQEQHSGSIASPRSTPEGHAQTSPRAMPPPSQTHPVIAGPALGHSPERGSNNGARRLSGIEALLNHDTMPAPVLIPVDQNTLAKASAELVHRSSGLSVEQLEQVMAALMRSIWASKGEWNRNKAVAAVSEAFNETVLDLESVQTILRPSQDDEEYAGVVGQGGGGSWGPQQTARV